MATTYKNLLNSDFTSNKTLLHESIPITGTIVSGTYAENNIKNFSHGMFQSVYDYPYLSSSANHIFDITVGYSNESNLSSSTNVQNKQKINIYNEMSQLLVGYDITGSIQQFDEDGDIAAGGTKIQEAIFVNMARLLTKDEVKKGSFIFKAQTGSVNSLPTDTLTINDASGSNGYKVNSPAGEYGVLYVSAVETVSDPWWDVGDPCGLIYYQAGIAVLTASVFQNFGTYGVGVSNPLVGSMNAFLTGTAISGNCEAFRNRFNNLAYNNTTELNSTIYFCRANHNEFNYSTNPTYLSGSKIVVKNNTQENPLSYITSIGLYSADNELLAVAKLSEPIKKDPTTELTFRVRLDY